MNQRHWLLAAALSTGVAACSHPGTEEDSGDTGSLQLARNGRLAVDVDFENAVQPYLVPTTAGIVVKALLTAGDSVNVRPDGTPYRMVGIPDGLGAYDNGDGTFTLLANHEIPTPNGI